MPRAYDIAVEIISHSDGHFNLENFTDFINAYQKVNYLNLGELWAIPIMLRLALIENLRRLSIEIAQEIANQASATTWADRMIEAVEKNPRNLVLVIADMARSDPRSYVPLLLNSIAGSRKREVCFLFPLTGSNNGFRKWESLLPN